jgi:hypothetical protein
VIAMAQSRRPLFRESALKQYMQRREKDILPRLVSTPVFAGLWLLLCVVIGLGLLVSWGKVPIFASGLGVIQMQAAQGQQNHNGQNPGKGMTMHPATQGTSEVLVVLPAFFRSEVHVGQLVWVQTSVNGPQITGRIDAVDPTVNAPGSVQPQYAQSGIASLFTQPSIVVRVKLNDALPHATANLVRVRVQIGSRRVISLLPGFDSIVKD